ncbi:MAG: helix-turn-helix domain-containing protein [bacterium]|nr:helix-turn-helix domain-containing protein [bacterium]
MNIFQEKKLSAGKRVCIRLKEAREKSHVSLDELATQTKISKQHLIAMEQCRFEDIPYAIIYQKNFIKKYAEILKLPVEDILHQFIIEEAQLCKKENKVHKEIHKKKFQNIPSFLRVSIIVIIAFALVGYLGWQIETLIKPPMLTLFSPENGLVTYNYELTVLGQTNQESKIFINGLEITSTGDGQFKEIINLSPGVNTIRVSAQKKHGKTTEIVRYVVYKSENQLSYSK